MTMARELTIYANAVTAGLQDDLGRPLSQSAIRLLFAETLTLTVAIVDDDREAVDLTGITTAWNLALKRPDDLDGTSLLAAKAGTVTDAAGGLVAFAFTGTDLASSGMGAYLVDPLAPPLYGKPVALEVYRMPSTDKLTYAAGTITAARGVYDPASGAPVNQPTIALAFGTGADGALAYSVADGWTLAGVAMVTSAGNWTVSGATLIILRSLNCTTGAIEAGAILQAGADNTGNWPTLNFTGMLTNAGTIRAHLSGINSVGGGMSTEGASRSTTGTGTTPTIQSISAISQAPAGGSGAGGGTSTAIGGSRHAPLASTYYAWGIRIAGGTTTAGATGAGANGTAIASLTYGTDPDTLLMLPGMPGAGGGSGGATVGSGTATSGAGGTPGRGGGILVINAWGITNSGTISADGEAGGNGGDAVTTGNGQAGGGGAGSGGGGGLVLIRYGAGGYTNTGTVQATRGAAGTGGAGSDSGSSSASYNGGNGGTSALGIVATAKIA